MPPLASLVSAIVLCSATALGQGSQQALTNDTFPFDNVAGRLVQFGAAALHPLEFSRDGAQLYALNQPGEHLAILDPTTVSRVGHVQIGICAVSVVAMTCSQAAMV